MKLFIWEDPYLVKWGMSLVVAIAETVEQAREVAIAASDAPDNMKRGGTLTLGEPTQVIDVPGATWFEWKE